MRSRAAIMFTVLVLPVAVLAVIAGGVRASCLAPESDDPVAIERAQIRAAEVVPPAGETWRIYASRAGNMLSTNACTGSARIDAAAGTPAPTPVRGSGNRLLLPIVMTAVVVILAAAVIPISRKLLR